MAQHKRIALLVVVMSAVVVAATATAIGLLYRTAYERERLHLIGNVQSHARMMEAIARFDESTHNSASGTARSATLAQIRDAYSRQVDVSGTAELTLGRREDDLIVFLMRHRHEETGRPDPVAFSSGLAEPMRRALSGESGSMVGLDYHGETVLAAFEPVIGLGLGIVAKVDLAEIRAPFFRAGAAVVGIAFVLIVAGTLVFIRVTNPMLAALRERGEKLSLLLASTGEGIFGMDVTGECTFANHSAAMLLGYEDPDALLGRDMHGLIHHTRLDGTAHPREECRILQALTKHISVHLDEEILWRADGSSFPAEFRARPMRRDGRVVGTVATFVDATERKARELQILHTQKMEVLGQLTGGIAHDFNNLLTVILGNLRFLEEDTQRSGDDDLQEIVGDALSAARDGAALTQRLLAFSRKQMLRPQPMDLNAFVRECVGFIRRVTGENIEVELALEPGILPIVVDRSQLHGALLNLTINGRDAMAGGGRLTISTGRAAGKGDSGKLELPEMGPFATLVVADSGVGMSAQVTRRAAEPFFTTKAPGKGSGLGLSMVYGFARQSGGRVSIQSCPGAGTTVTLYLPEAVACLDTVDHHVMPARHSASDRSVLVVEDEPRLRKFVERCLVSLGYRVSVAGHAAEARAIFTENSGEFDLLLSDIVMPGDMDGRALARWALARWPDLGVLLTTGFNNELHDDCIDEFPVLLKPFGRSELEAAIAGVLGGSQPKQSDNVQGTVSVD